MNNENGIPGKKFLVGKAIAKGIEGAIIAGFSSTGGITMVEQLEQVDISKKEEVLTTAALMVIGFIFRYLRNWIKNKRR